jgi:hypothetical protein
VVEGEAGTLASVVLAEWSASFGKETGTFEVLLAHRAVEALAVVVVVERFNPAIACLNGEPTREALCGEQFIPISFTVRKGIFQEERVVSKQLATICAAETLRVEVLTNCVQTVPLDFAFTFIAVWREVLLKAELTVEPVLFLNKPNVLEWSLALCIHANKVVRAPDLPEGRYERASCDRSVTLDTNWMVI